MHTTNCLVSINHINVYMNCNWYADLFEVLFLFCRRTNRVLGNSRYSLRLQYHHRVRYKIEISGQLNFRYMATFMQYSCSFAKNPNKQRSYPRTLIFWLFCVNLTNHKYIIFAQHILTILYHLLLQQRNFIECPFHANPNPLGKMPRFSF